MLENQAFQSERYALAVGRLQEIGTETLAAEPFRDYFQKTANQILDWYAIACAVHTQKLQPLEQLQAQNHALYAELLPVQYETSYANPAYAVRMLGEDFGSLFSMLYAELRGMIAYAYEGKSELFLIFTELFLQVYGCFADGEKPTTKEVRDCLYWFYSDYSELFLDDAFGQQLQPQQHSFARDILMHADLQDLRYLYAFGQYITDNERKTAAYLNSLPQEEINAMAHTMSEGYRIGFEVTGKDLSKKRTVALSYHLGFERMMRQVVLDFEKLGLDVAVYSSSHTTLQRRGGFEGADPNPQFTFDHRSDKSVYLDKRYVERRLGAQKKVLEQYKDSACLYAGPAVQEVFGEQPFTPTAKKENCSYTEKQQKLLTELTDGSARLNNAYLHSEETSFTIIAYPLPEIGTRYEEIFREIVKINTLDYMKYRRIQQTLIDALDRGVQVRVTGKGENCTDLTVALYPLTDPKKQTIFENCVADVNIPVGEVFTSPVLAGTNGTLFVTCVYLNGLQFRNLCLTFTDGMVTDYTCDNFADEEDNRKYVRENVLAYHDTLPMGEFAIGTNTTAYMAGRKYQIADKLPILIAEKTGPHFAVGDTCYSHEEDIKTYNPDGKEIVARDNACSALRNTDPSKAYFHTHLDITIPYDELARICVVHEDGSETDLILDGRFVLPGTEALNEALDA